jgi:CBS domain-containing protein
MSTVGDILARKGHEVISVRPTATVLNAANLMNERGIGGVLVLEGDELVGIFTERDVLRRVVAQGRDPATTLVSSVMSSPVTGAEPRMSIDECAALMTERRIRHLPVRGTQGISGMITIGDVLAFQVSEQQTTIQHMNSYIYDLR